MLTCHVQAVGNKIFRLTRTDWTNLEPKKPSLVMKGPTVIKKYVLLFGRVGSQIFVDKK